MIHASKWGPCPLALLLLLLVGDGIDHCSHVASFRPPSLTVSSNRVQRTARRNAPLKAAKWQDKFGGMLGGKGIERKEENIDHVSGSNNEEGVGAVVRLAAKAYNTESSKPSSQSYTTRKVEIAQAHVTTEGVQDDYNHYRTVALKSTKDRAVSLLTNDVMTALRSAYPNYDIEDGDLGENISIGGLTFDFFRVGRRYKLVADQTQNEGVPALILEITEKMEPCANICKLSFINDGSLEPKQRIERCQDFLQYLDRHDGYRGWYAKVVQEGTVSKGAKVILLEDD